MPATKKRVPYFTSYETVEVEIDPEDLHDSGWHHETECSGAPDPIEPVLDLPSLTDALASLHRQAHPTQGRIVAFCREEPCRSLSL